MRGIPRGQVLTQGLARRLVSKQAHVFRQRLLASFLLARLPFSWAGFRQRNHFMPQRLKERNSGSAQARAENGDR